MAAAAPDALEALLDDLQAEGDDLESALAPLDDAAWARPTPAEGWTISHQIAHLVHGEELAALAAGDPGAFAAELDRLLADLQSVAAAEDERALSLPGPALLAAWTGALRATITGLRGRPADDRISWVYGPISARSFATARLMETWAHGQDVVDALATERSGTARLRHIAHLGVATRRFSFTNRGLEPPAAEVRVELAAPDGETWTWGDPGAPERLTGPALDFCLLVTQRRHGDDLALRVEGAGAVHWLAIAQCFAGAPTEGRPPR